MSIVRANASTGAAGASGAMTVIQEYDAQGNLRKVKRNAGQGEIVTERQYDGLGRLTSPIDPDRGITDFVYNAAGELIRSTDPSGV